MPTLGICYGMQLMAQELGGRVDRTGASEFGKTELRAHEGALFHDLPAEQTVWMSHRDSVVAAPTGARVVAGSDRRRSPRSRTTRAGSTASSSTPEVVHTRTASRC